VRLLSLGLVVVADNRDRMERKMKEEKEHQSGTDDQDTGRKRKHHIPGPGSSDFIPSYEMPRVETPSYRDEPSTYQPPGHSIRLPGF
jgi:hypothetical protein